MSVKSNDMGNSARPALMLQISLLSVFFWYCMEVPDTNLGGGIVQSVTPSMLGKLNSTCVLVLLFIFKLHFLDTMIVSVMDSVEYTYQGFIQWEAGPGFPPRIEMNILEAFIFSLILYPIMFLS